jgi:hypothetical protein
MDDHDRKPTYKPAANEGGPGWHVVITWPDGRTEVQGNFASESEALDWIVANSGSQI